MSILGWRLHFTRRHPAWPREATPFMREFSALFSGLDQGLGDLGVPEGQPFLVDPAGQYDVALNRYFSVWLAASPWNTQAAHARDLRTYFHFQWFRRGRCGWRDAAMDDRAAYEGWRRRDEPGPRADDTSWDREVSTVNQFSLWAIEQDLVRANPVRQRAAVAWSPWRRGVGGTGASSRGEAAPGRLLALDHRAEAPPARRIPDGLETDPGPAVDRHHGAGDVGRGS